MKNYRLGDGSIMKVETLDGILNYLHQIISNLEVVVDINQEIKVYIRNYKRGKDRVKYFIYSSFSKSLYYKPSIKEVLTFKYNMVYESEMEDVIKTAFKKIYDVEIRRVESFPN